MEKASKELLKEFVNSQKFTSTTDIMNSMKELFSDVLQQVMEAELEEKLGYEKSERIVTDDENGCRKNYRNGYSKKTVKTQLGEVDVKIPRDRNGEYEPQIIGKYNRNADGMEEKILGLYACGMSQRDIIYPDSAHGIHALACIPRSLSGSGLSRREILYSVCLQTDLLIGRYFTQNFSESPKNALRIIYSMHF